MSRTNCPYFSTSLLNEKQQFPLTAVVAFAALPFLSPKKLRKAHGPKLFPGCEKKKQNLLNV